MRQVITFLAVSCAGLMVLCVAVFGYSFSRGLGLDRTGKAYAQSAVSAITSHWDPREFRVRATDDLNSRIDDQKLVALFVWFSSLGHRIIDKGCQGGITRIYRSFPSEPGATSGRYDCLETFQEGDATISITLIRQNGAWQITGFRVNSDALGPNTPTQRL
jgi:hypothetical protein